MNLPSDRAALVKSAEFHKRINAKLSDFDVRGVVRVLSSDDSFAPLDADTLNSLQAKHPQPSRPLSMPPEPTPSDDCLQVSAAEVRRAITNFASGSVAGPDGFHPKYLKDLISISAD